MKNKLHFDAHVNQLADENDCLRVDNIEIQGKISKSGKFFIAKSAVEYTIEETETETIEGEETVELNSALQTWVYPIGKVKLIENVIPVLCSDKIWRPLVWVDENGIGRCFQKG